MADCYPVAYENFRDSAAISWPLLISQATVLQNVVMRYKAVTNWCSINLATYSAPWPSSSDHPGF